MIEELPCLTCKGTKEVYYICQNKMIPCYGCGATGIQVRDARWAEQGRLLRTERLKRDLSMREAAKLTGINVVQFSAMEFGKADPTPALTTILVRPVVREHPVTKKLIDLDEIV